MYCTVDSVSNMDYVILSDTSALFICVFITIYHLKIILLNKSYFLNFRFTVNRLKPIQVQKVYCPHRKLSVVHRRSLIKNQRKHQKTNEDLVKQRLQVIHQLVERSGTQQNLNLIMELQFLN